MHIIRKDIFMAVYAVVWVTSNIVAYYMFGNDGTLISNAVFIVMLILVLMCRPLMRWLNEK